MKVGLAFSQMESLMIKIASEMAFLALCFFLAAAAMTALPTTAVAAPIPQTEDMSKSELEKMIMERIEAKRKENEAKNKSGKSSTDSKSWSSSRNRASSTPSRNRSSSPSRPQPRLRATQPSFAEEESGGGSIPRARRDAGETQYTESTQMKGAIKANVDPDVRILFNFVDDEWQEVIEFFAEQAGFGVYYGSTGPPQGTLTYSDSVERSIISGLDFLNSRLSVLQPSHVLVRNGNQLVLVNESEPYPDQLIALITPDQLDEFGEYEVASCQFKLGKFANGNKLALELREDVSEFHLDGFSYSDTSNMLTIRERVRVLRRFYSQIQPILDIDDKKITKLYQLKSLDAETLLDIARPLLGIEDDASGFEDGSLSFTLDPLGTTVYLRGTPDRILEFEELAAKIDAIPSDDSVLVEKPYFQTHRIAGGDAEVVFQVLQNLLDGEPNLKMDQDANNGNIYLEAPKSIHDKVADFLANLNPGDSFSVITVNNLTPSEAKSTVEELLGIGGFDPPEGSPRIVADSDLDRLMVNGTPSQIIEIKRIVSEIDGTITSSNTTRRPLRMIPMSPGRQEEVMKALQIDGIMELKGRKNLLNVIMPKDRLKPRSGIRIERRGGSESKNDSGQGSSRGREGSTSVFKPKRHYFVSTDNPRQENEDAVGKVSTRDPFEDEPPQQLDAPFDDSAYAPADEIPSVPGAPIEVQMSERGLIIKSNDLDAADDLEDLIDEMFDPGSEWQRPTIIPLEHRDVEEANTLLKYFLGLESDGGGGGGGLGGIGGLLGGAVQNAVGGAAGDALSGFLGGGGSDFGPSESAGAIELEGEDVRFATDIRFNTLIVTGATGNDIDIILELVEYIDQPGPPQRPRTQGMTYQIQVQYRDPMELKDLIMAQLPDYFRAAPAQAGNQGNARQQLENQVARQLQQAMQGGGRGNRRGGGGGAAANNNSERPKATLGVDETRRVLLVTGPKFIYDEVNELVLQLDQKDESMSAIVESGTLAPSVLADMLRQTLGDQINIRTAEDLEAGSSGGTPPAGGGGAGAARGGATGRGNTASRNLERNILNQINQRGGAGGRGGGRGGGGGGRGGRGGR